jgi:hypothetical protein
LLLSASCFGVQAAIATVESASRAAEIPNSQPDHIGLLADFIASMILAKPEVKEKPGEPRPFHGGIQPAGTAKIARFRSRASLRFS